MVNQLYDHKMLGLYSGFLRYSFAKIFLALRASRALRCGNRRLCDIGLWLSPCLTDSNLPTGSPSPFRRYSPSSRIRRICLDSCHRRRRLGSNACNSFSQRHRRIETQLPFGTRQESVRSSQHLFNPSASYLYAESGSQPSPSSNGIITSPTCNRRDHSSVGIIGTSLWRRRAKA